MKNWIAGLKEFGRKRLVALKRKPQTIALVVLGVAFVYYSLNLTQISDTTAYIQGSGMGLSAFVIMLFSLLSMVCFLNAFPHRKKVNIPMLALMFAMLGGVIFCDFYYDARIDQAIEARRQQYVVEAVGNIQKAQSDAALTDGYVEEAKAASAAAEKAAAAVADIEAAIAEASANADADAAKKAADDVAKAAKNAADAVKSAATAVETATTSAAEAAAKAEEAPACDTLDAVNTAAKAATTAAGKAKTAATNAAAAATKAADAQKKAAAALETLTGVKAEAEEAAAEQKSAADAVQTVAEPVELLPSVTEEALARGDQAVVKLLDEHPSIPTAIKVMSVHRVILIVAMALVALLPVYAPLLRKIRTSIEVEANENMGDIELDGSDE